MDNEIEINEDTGAAVGTGNAARLAMLDRINNANDHVRAVELADVNDDDTTSEFVAELLSDEEQAAREAALQADADGITQTELDRFAEEANLTAPEEPAPVVPKHKIKVNGKELELTTEELIERAQKIEAADGYLIEAARIKREAEAARPVLPPAPVEPLPEPTMTEDEERALVRAIQMGTEDEALHAWRQMKGSQTVQPTIDRNVIAQEVRERLSFEEAARTFRSNFSDLMDDPVLAQMVTQRDAALAAANDPRPFLERFTAVGEEVRQWRDGLVKKHAPASAAPAQTTEQRLAAKQVATSKAAPKPANVRAPAKPDDDDTAPEKPSDVIARMAQARGGSQYMRH